MGNVLEDGDFDFTLEVTDSGCNPFSTTTATFRMSVGVGEITVVEALLDGNPVLIPAGGESYNPDYPALPETVYNDYVTIQLVVAGGKGPYAAVIFDHPDIPNDGPLPLGAAVPPNAASITGAPVEVGPGGGPFLITLRDRGQHRRQELLHVLLARRDARDHLRHARAGRRPGRRDLQPADLRRRGRAALRLRVRRGGPPRGLHERQERQPRTRSRTPT